MLRRDGGNVIRIWEFQIERSVDSLADRNETSLQKFASHREYLSC